MEVLSKKKVLIINPAARGGYLFVPYLWLCFKSHYLDFGKYPKMWEWCEPIVDFDNLEFQVIIESILRNRPDVIGLSYFLWNEKINNRIAEELKRQSPKTIIIAGGPHLNHRQNPRWFLDHPWIDVICNPEGYGEDFMTPLLDQMTEDCLDFSNVPNALYPSNDKLTWSKSLLGTNKRTFQWPVDLFRDSKNYLQGLSALAELSHKNLILLWETNRGCPYGCVYCEWGGGTMSKMNIKPIETVMRELEFMKEISLHTLHINDANFGMLKRDLTITESVVELKKLGKLKRVWLGGKNKNDKAIVKKIDRLLLENDLGQDGFQISVNALDEKQLKAINRTNLSVEEHLEIIKEITTDFNIEADFELILGLPESNLQTLFNEYDIYEKGNLWSTERFPWALLPETPSSNPEYIKKFSIKTVKAPAHVDDQWIQRDLSGQVYNILRDPHFISTFDMVIETSSYKSEEWVEMLMVDNFVRAMECSGFTSKIRVWLKENSGVSASQFYRTIWSKFISYDPVKLIHSQLLRFTSGINDNDDYTWFRSFKDSKQKIKMEAYFNLVVLDNPSGFYELIENSFKEVKQASFHSLMDLFKVSVLQGNIEDMCVQLKLKKVNLDVLQ
jgi:putative methyltransferase